MKGQVRNDVLQFERIHKYVYQFVENSRKMEGVQKEFSGEICHDLLKYQIIKAVDILDVASSAYMKGRVGKISRVKKTNQEKTIANKVYNDTMEEKSRKEDKKKIWRSDKSIFLREIGRNVNSEDRNVTSKKLRILDQLRNAIAHPNAMLSKCKAIKRIQKSGGISNFAENSIGFLEKINTKTNDTCTKKKEQYDVISKDILNWLMMIKKWTKDEQND